MTTNHCSDIKCQSERRPDHSTTRILFAPDIPPHCRDIFVYPRKSSCTGRNSDFCLSQTGQECPAGFLDANACKLTGRENSPR